MAAHLDLAIFPEDKVIAFPDPKLGIGSKIEIIRATEIIVSDATKIKTYRTWQNNVKDFFAEKNIVLGQEDSINIDINSILFDDMEIIVNRVHLEEIKEFEEIPYETIYEDDYEMEKGLSEVRQYPESGQKELTYLIKSENGKEIIKELVNSEVKKGPVNKIIVRGAKIVKLGSGKATWYDLIGGMTAASNVLPYGTKVLVRNNSNGKTVEVTIVDHGIQSDAIIDLSDEAFSKIAPLGSGIISVSLEKP